MRRYDIEMGPYQSELIVFPKTKFGDKMRQFNPDWYKPPYSSWLEYNIKDDAAFCLYCYLFKNEFESRGNAGRAFVDDDFRREPWFLLRNALSFRGHDESEDSEYKDLFLELLEFHGSNRPDMEKLELPLVVLSRKHFDVKNLFYVVTNVLNTIGTSFKRRELLRQHQVEKLEELLKAGEIFTGQGLNQERGLQRPGDTRWGSHFKTLKNFMIIFSSIANVLKDMKEDSPLKLDRLVAGNLLDNIQEFEFVLFCI
ncbi:uncharacterized protein LOC132612288 [Lycium barbarum]|uniref:uncharacterized protein LOC132612288 n=1 Tax=Lycium barbarum TaxID=112863 RepID=UPI00293E0B5F|nr:uncharacterized protein LOC132612288 [Lycium barbarum]